MPLDTSTEITDLPVGVYTSVNEVAAQQPMFVSNCTVCDVSFATQEESVNHFESGDHETAQVCRIDYCCQFFLIIVCNCPAIKHL